MKIPVAMVLSLVITASAFTNTKVAHIEDARKEHDNPDLVGYTSTAETPDFHFRRLGTTSAATEFAQVTVKFDLNKLHRHITAISTTVQEAAAMTPEDQGLEIHMYQQLDSELRSLRERVEYIFHLVGTNEEKEIHRQKRLVFTVAFAILASAIAVGASIYTAVEVNKSSDISSLTERQRNTVLQRINVQDGIPHESIWRHLPPAGMLRGRRSLHQG